MISLLHLNNNSLLILSNRLPQWLSSKESACNAGGAGDSGLIPGSVRSPGGGHGNLLHILAWKIPWTEEPGGLKPVRSHRVGHN